jgi:hypothetical protein
MGAYKTDLSRPPLAETRCSGGGRMHLCWEEEEEEEEEDEEI